MTRYRIDNGWHAEGGFGQVFLGRDRQLGNRKVVIKRVKCADGPPGKGGLVDEVLEKLIPPHRIPQMKKKEERKKNNKKKRNNTNKRTCGIVLGL